MQTNNNRIRLIYVYFEAFNRYGTGQKFIGKTYGVSSPFTLPQGMTMDEACKVISFLSKKVETENDIEPASESSVAKVSEILEDYGFDRNEGHTHGHFHAVQECHPIGVKITDDLNHIEGVVDLFTVDGDFKLFKQSSLYNRYFDWFSEDVTKREVKKIFNKVVVNMNEKIEKIRDIKTL